MCLQATRFYLNLQLPVSEGQLAIRRLFSGFWCIFIFAVGLGILQALLCYYCLRSPLLLCWRWWEGHRKLQVHLCFTSVNPIQSHLLPFGLPFWAAEVQNLCRKQRCLMPFRQRIKILTRTVVQSVCNPNVAVLN